MTVVDIYGNIHLLRAYTKPDGPQEIAYQQIAAVVDTFRACRNQLRNHLAGTWSTEEADEFRRANADLNQVDGLLVGATATDLIVP